jgi:hypothetical protein
MNRSRATKKYINTKLTKTRKHEEDQNEQFNGVSYTFLRAIFHPSAYV